MTEIAAAPGICARCGGPIEPGMRTGDIGLVRFHERCAYAAAAELMTKSRRSWRHLGRRMLRKSDVIDWAVKYCGDGDGDGGHGRRGR
jgi:hypothetical protein